MFDSFYRKSKQVELKDDKRVQFVVDALFPDYLTRVTKDGDKYCVDSSVDLNLETVYQDISDGFLDEYTLQTLRTCINKIAQIRETLKVQQKIDAESQRFIISMDPEKVDLDDITPDDEPEL